MVQPVDLGRNRSRDGEFGIHGRRSTEAMMRYALVFLTASVALAQIEGVKFEVASIKPNTADPHQGGVDTGNGLLRSINTSIKRSIMGAYSVGPNQIVGG